MAINIQNIIDQITTKAAAADSSMNTDYLLSLSKAVLAMNQASGVIEYKQKEYLPDVDSSHLGSFAFIRSGIDLDSVYGDSYGAFFYAARVGSRDSAWDRIKTGVDSNAENPPAPYTFQGTVSGYTTGGASPSRTTVIDKFSFVSDGNATDVGDRTVEKKSSAGQSSRDNGYVSGGSPTINVIDRFPFAVDTNATDVGDLTVARHSLAGQSSASNGYSSGGDPYTNIIDKFPFSTDANATDVGDLTVSRRSVSGQSSTTNGYTSGGGTPSEVNIIDKFPFATDANATDVGDLSISPYVNRTGQSSADNGYTTVGTPLANVIDKFPFAVDANATDIGNLSVVRNQVAGQSSTTNGYTSGGKPTSNVIDKFPFSVDAGATDVGNLTVGRYGGSGQQV